MSGLFSFLVLGADRPSIDGLGDWIGNEVGTGIGLIVLIVGIVHWATGKYGRMIALNTCSGPLETKNKRPPTINNAISGIWKMIFGG